MKITAKGRIGVDLMETKQETNFEHYFEYLSTIRMSEFALIDGRVKECSATQCSECDFNHDCIEKKFKWLKQPYKKQTYKLSQFEYDLLQSYASVYKLKDINILIVMKEKGYFNDIDPFTKVHEIIDNCEVIQ